MPAAVAARLPDVSNSVFERARAGGRHSGFLRQNQGKSENELQRARRSLEKQVLKHQDKIANADSYIDRAISARQRQALIESYWPKEIKNFSDQIDILDELIKRQ